MSDLKSKGGEVIEKGDIVYTPVRKTRGKIGILTSNGNRFEAENMRERQAI